MQSSWCVVGENRKECQTIFVYMTAIVFLCHRKDAPEKTLAVKVMKKSELVQKNMVDQVGDKRPVGSF